MKNSLFSVVLTSLVSAAVLCGGRAFAAEAKTSATPKAQKNAKAADASGANQKDAKKKDAKKKPAAKKATGFAAYDAGPWKPVDERKTPRCWGPRLTNGDFPNQPVMVIKFDPSVTVTSEMRSDDPKYFKLWYEASLTSKLDYLLIVGVPSRELTKEDLAPARKIQWTSGGFPDCPCYLNVGLEKEPDNPGGQLPFYYVVSADNKVVYAGGDGKRAYGVLKSSLRKAGTPDPLYGFVKPSVHADLCAKFQFGQDTGKLVQKLKPIAQKGSGEAKEEAAAILNALDQTRGYYARQIACDLWGEPYKSLMLAKQVSKTYPRFRSEVQEIVARVEKNPDVAKNLKAYVELTGWHERLQNQEEGKPFKKSDLNKAYQMALAGERKCAKARKEFGDKVPTAYVKFEDLVQTVKAELEAAGAKGK